MAWVDPNTVSNPTTGAIITAAWGDIIRDDLEYLARNSPHCEAYRSSSQSIPHNTATNITFPSETYDVGGIHSTSVNTDRLTVPSGEDGKYDISAGAQFAAAGGGYRQIRITKNGADLIPDRHVTFDASTTAVTSLALSLSAVPLVAGDIVRLLVIQSQGGALNVESAYLAIKWVAA